jgi:hypothetical protein
MPGAFMIEHLARIALIDQLAAAGAVVEMVSLVGRLGAESLSWEKRAEIGQLGHSVYPLSTSCVFRRGAT